MNVIDAMVEANDLYPVRRETWPKRYYVILDVENGAKIYRFNTETKEKEVYKPTPDDLLALDWELATEED